MKFLQSIPCGVLATVLLAGTANAAWPEKTITIIVPAALAARQTCQPGWWATK